MTAAQTATHGYRVAASVAPEFVPVMVCGPATVAVQTAPEQEPFGAMVNVVPAVTSPRLSSSDVPEVLAP